MPDENYVSFLERTKFDKTNYVLMEKWLSNLGDSAQAEKVFLAKRDWANREAIRDRNLAFRLFNRLGHFASKCFLLLAFRSFSWALIGLVVLGITCWVFHDPLSVRDKHSKAVPRSDEWGPVKSIRMACNIHFPGAPVSLLEQWEPSKETVVWPWKSAPGTNLDLSYHDYANLAWGVTYVLVLPMLGIGVLIKWLCRREGERAS